MAEETEFRVYIDDPSNPVYQFYDEHHKNSTLAASLQRRNKFLQFGKPGNLKLTMHKALELCEQIVDKSDPDTSLSQQQHNYQAAEASRYKKEWMFIDHDEIVPVDHHRILAWKAKDGGFPEWFQLIALLHDVGKILEFFGEPQWAVVGDTYPVGCQFSPKIVHYNLLKGNPDMEDPILQSKMGIYEGLGEGCGLANIMISWGHDEYLYQVLMHNRIAGAPELPDEALAIVRYHSCYPVHNAEEYQHFLSDADRKMMPWVKEFQRFDLYSKDKAPVHIEEVRKYYHDMISKYFPQELDWGVPAEKLRLTVP